jgi:hypothetical protein
MSYKYFPSMSYKYSPNDVLTLKGAAAQQTTHPGNLIYYQLCEERFAEYESSSQQQRREICHEIATSIVKKRGGVFRKYNGSKMDEKAAITKTKDRMRQIQKPKIVPPENVGEHDVVFKVGAANHLFPGNAKWRALLDKYVQRYWPELFPTSECNGSTPTATNLLTLTLTLMLMNQLLPSTLLMEEKRNQTIKFNLPMSSLISSKSVEENFEMQLSPSLQNEMRSFEKYMIDSRI